MSRWLLLSGFAVFALSVAAHAQFSLPMPDPSTNATTGSADADQPKVRFETAWAADAVHPGDQFALAIQMDIADGWHVQTQQKKYDWQSPTTVELANLPPGVRYGDIQWPVPKPAEYDAGNGPQMFDFFIGESTIFIKLSMDEDVEPGDYEITAKVHWQACDDTTCLLPQTTELSMILRVAAPETATSPRNESVFADYAGRGTAELLTFRLFGLEFSIDPSVTWLLLAVAAAGGLLLNLTPCVLPMIPIKIMGLSRAASNRGGSLVLGVVMSLGVVAFWTAIGAAIAFIAGFDSINELFKHSWFTIGVGAVIALMGLGMWGAFATNLPQWVYRINPSQETVHGAFGFGIMTAVLATPCTAPFMGTAAAWAVTEDPATILNTFAAIGAGMALPYLVLAAFPQLVDRVPRTGPASELVKQVMGLFMLAAAAYFIGTGITGAISSPPDPPSDAYWYPVGLFIGLAGLWLAWRSIQIASAGGVRVFLLALGAVFVVAGAATAWSLTRPGPIDWIYYTPERLAEARSADVVVLDFTAAWCLNCHTLERAVLNREAVASRLNRPNVAPIKVDITRYEPAQQLLTEVGSRTIPLLIIYDSQGNEVFRSDAYSVSDVTDAVDEAMSRAASASARD